MDEVIKFIRDNLQEKKPGLQELMDEASTHFNIELAPSDLSFINIQYRNVLTELWADECLGKLKEKVEANGLDDDKVLELLEIFRGLEAFDETPDYLQGDFYKLLKDERHIFTPKNFTKL